MLEKTHKGQAALWILVVIAIVALIFLWISKKPISISTNIPAAQTINTPTASVTPTPSMNLDEVGKELKNLNTSASEIDNSINDTQLDITQ